MLQEKGVPTADMALWMKVIDGKEIDERMESEYRQMWCCIEDTKELRLEEQMADFMIVVLTYLHLFKGKRGSYLKAKGIRN